MGKTKRNLVRRQKLGGIAVNKRGTQNCILITTSLDLEEIVGENRIELSEKAKIRRKSCQSAWDSKLQINDHKSRLMTRNL